MAIRPPSSSASYGVLARTVVGAGGATSIDFSSIAATYEGLHLVLMARGTDAAAVVSVALRFNNDSGANYDFGQVYGGQVAVGNTGSGALTSLTVGSIAAGGAPAGNVGMSEIRVPGYARSVFRKIVTASGGDQRGATGGVASFITGLWRSTAAINRVTLTLSAGDFAEGSVATLYGIA